MIIILVPRKSSNKLLKSDQMPTKKPRYRDLTTNFVIQNLLDEKQYLKMWIFPLS